MNQSICAHINPYKEVAEFHLYPSEESSELGITSVKGILLFFLASKSHHSFSAIHVSEFPAYVDKMHKDSDRLFVMEYNVSIEVKEMLYTASS